MSVSRLPGASGIPLTTVTAKGDLITGTAASSVSNLPVGSNGQVLAANSAVANGMNWVNAGGSYTAPTLGSTLISSGATVPSIAGLTKLTTAQYTSTDGNGYEVDNILMNLMGAY
jgi:hypothetical protein